MTRLNSQQPLDICSGGGVDDDGNSRGNVANCDDKKQADECQGQRRGTTR